MDNDAIQAFAHKMVYAMTKEQNDALREALGHVYSDPVVHTLEFLAVAGDSNFIRTGSQRALALLGRSINLHIEADVNDPKDWKVVYDGMG
jgi:hypothetical protein